MIRARLRSGASWADACILNLSPRGMGLQSASPPGRGSYVELRRGHHVIVARVMWTNGHRFGIRSQDTIPVDSVISEPDLSAANDGAPPAPVIERRTAPRFTERHDGSRTLSRSIQFGFVLILGASAGLTLFDGVRQAFGKPLESAAAALGEG